MNRGQLALLGVAALGLGYVAYRGARSVTDRARALGDAVGGAFDAGAAAAAATGRPIGKSVHDAVQWTRDLLGLRTELGERIARQEQDLAELQRAQRAAGIGAVRLPQSEGIRTYQAPARTVPGVRRPWGS